MNKKHKIRKPRPSMPHWFWLDNDNCWFCNNKNGCSGCKLCKRTAKKQKDQRDRQLKQKLKNKEYD